MCCAQRDVELQIRNLLILAYNESRRNGHTPVMRASDVQIMPLIESDLKIRCQQCDQLFDFTVDEQTFYRMMGFYTPHRCVECR